jgi:hypothetical protein
VNLDSSHYKKAILYFLLFFIWHVGYAEDASQRFEKLADEYFDTVYLPFNPTEAVSLGLHQYDDKMENFSLADVQENIARLQKFEKRVAAVNTSELDVWTYGDWELVLNSIRSDLLTLQSIRPYEKDPDYYSSGLSSAAFVLISRNFASQDDRMRSMIAQLRRSIWPLSG